MDKEILNELQTIWPTLGQTRTRLMSNTFRRLSLLCRRESDSSLLPSLSSSPNNPNFTMQNCCLTCKSDENVEKSTFQTALEPCEFCFDQSSPAIMIDIFNVNHERQSTEPVSVPNSPTTTSINNQQQNSRSNSSGYESGFGNELSPLMNYWTLGVNDFSSYTSSTSDDLSNDQDQSIFDGSSTTDGVNEQELDDDDEDSFEVLSFDGPPESSLYIKEFQHTTSTDQNNVCNCCNIPFSSISNFPARRCHYYGKLYCARCHIMDYAYIPAKIIKSFDMRLYPVCRRAKSILQLSLYQPIFDIQNDNENLYTSVPLLSEIKSIRLQFQHFYAYLSTCPRIENELNENFFKEFHARDYLYQSVHLYSLDDLLSLKKVLNILNRASIQAKQHINQCVICQARGFTCEICKNRTDILYPFDDVKTIGRCDRCSNIYHRQCWDNIDHDCPKCYRLIQRKCEQDEI